MPRENNFGQQLPSNIIPAAPTAAAIQGNGGANVFFKVQGQTQDITVVIPVTAMDSIGGAYANPNNPALIPATGSNLDGTSGKISSTNP